MRPSVLYQGLLNGCPPPNGSLWLHYLDGIKCRKEAGILGFTSCDRLNVGSVARTVAAYVHYRGSCLGERIALFLSLLMERRVGWLKDKPEKFQDGLWRLSSLDHIKGGSYKKICLLTDLLKVTVMQLCVTDLFGYDVVILRDSNYTLLSKIAVASNKAANRKACHTKVLQQR